MASSLGSQQFSWFRRLCYNDNSKYYDMKYYCELFADKTEHSDGSVTYSNFSATFKRVSEDFGYKSYCPSEDGRCIPSATSCCSTFTLQINMAAITGGENWQYLGQYTTSYALASDQWTKWGIPGEITLQPGQSTQLKIGRTVACKTDNVYFTLTNTNTKPQPSPPSISISCSANSGVATAGSMSIGGGYGYCDSQRNSLSWSLNADSASGQLITSGTSSSSSFAGLSPNRQYVVSATKSNGCYTRSATCSFVTLTPNTISDAKATSWQSACVRVAVTYGGKKYEPTTTVRIKKCNGGSWQNVGTTDTTTVDEVCFEGLEEDTCYQVQACTRTTAGTYCGNTLTFTTPKKCIQGTITSTDIALDQKTWESYAKVCVAWEAYTSPSTLTVQYRVKGGYDPEWKESEPLYVTDPIVNVGDKLSGVHCFVLHDLFPNLTEYEMRLHGVAEQDDCDLYTDPTTFITPLVPEPDPVKVCETLTYLTELICQSTKKLYEGNKTIYANDYSVQFCDPENEDPTHMTLWSRLLRFFQAMDCLVCGMVDVGLKSGTDKQYYVGEVGWVDMLDEVLADTNKESWRLVASNAIRGYIDLKLHEVWHYHGAVDYLVDTIAQRNDLPTGTKTVLVKETNKLYEYINGSWEEAEQQPDDFAVYHINNSFGYVKAEQAWYYFQGTWNNLDADTAALAKIVQEMWDTKDQLAYTQGGGRTSIYTADYRKFLCSDYPDDGKSVIFITEPTHVTPPGYHLITFRTGVNATIVQDQEVLDGALGQQPTDPEKTCMDFVVWNDRDTNQPFDWTKPVTKDYNLEAVWQPHPVKITFDIGEKASGSIPAPINGYCGDLIGTLPDSGFTRPGGTFQYWAIDGVPIDGNYELVRDATAKAVWKMEEVRVTFVFGNGQDNVIKVAEYDTTVQAPADPTRNEFIFTGWYMDAAATTPWDNAAGVITNITVYAGWIPASYRVEFDSNGGSSVPAQIVAYQEYATRPNDPTKDGYIIRAWQLDGKDYNFDVPVTADITLTAVWQKVWIVSFDTDGGSPDIASQVIVDGEEAHTVPDPTKDGCTFLGWMAEGETDLFDFETRVITSDIKLVAQYSC